MKKLALFSMLAMMLMLVPAPAQAQFGQNQVMWEKTTWNFYQSAHFDYYFSLDIKDENVREHFAGLAAHLEGSYEYLSGQFNHNLKKRPIVVVSRTHSTFEALHLIGGELIPEGVGAYAMPRGSLTSDLILSVKPDFLPVLNRTIYTHELVHIFQYDMLGFNFLARSLGSDPVEGWIYEATADQLAHKYAPYSRDDIRKMEQRTAASNTKNPQFGLPTLEMLSQGQTNPYSMGAMVFEFLEARFGEKAVLELVVNIFKGKGRKFIEHLADLSQGELSTPEAFDRAHRDYWASKYAKDSLDRPKPYQDTSSVSGRQVITVPQPYPLTSPVVCPNGKQVVFLTYNPKNGVVLAVAPTLAKEDPPYVPQEKGKRNWLFGQKVTSGQAPPRVLTNFMPPKHYEYVIGQQLNVWPFNGFDLDCWQDSAWQDGRAYSEGEIKIIETKIKMKQDNDKNADVSAEKRELDEVRKRLEKSDKQSGVSYIALFGRKNRDHALFIIDVHTGKFVYELELPLDQAFSPSFTPDGTTVVFSAAKNISRDIYSLDLKSRALTNLTNGGVFNSAPRVSRDGSVAYVAFVGGFQKLFLLNGKTGEKDQLTFGRWNDNSPSWSSDGTHLVFSSDEKDQIWNLYTMEMSTGKVSQWTEFYGGAFTASFVPGENDRLVYSAYLEEDQFRSYVYPNFELFDAKLKEPLRTYQNVQTVENMELAFRPEEAVREDLDESQLEHPVKPPARWKFYGKDVHLGSSTYWGTFAYTRIQVQDILANRTHALLYAQQGDLRYFDYTYVDRSRRLGLAVAGTHAQYPLYYTLYNIEGQKPRYTDPLGEQSQFTLNETWVKESSVTLYGEYPFNKWDRLEFGVRPRKRSYILPYDIGPEERAGFETSAHPLDVQFYDFFKSSSGQTNVGLTTAFVHDTVSYSYDTLGPLYGNALRVQTEFGPGIGKKSNTYVTGLVDARKYFRLSSSMVFAVRGAGLYSTRASGDFMLLGGDGTLRNYPYGSIAGNQVGYGSAELRLPLADVALLGAFPIRVRGVAFGDYAVSRFTDDMFETRKEWSYGFGMQAWFILPMNFEWSRTKFSPHKWNFNFRIGLNF